MVITNTPVLDLVAQSLQNGMTLISPHSAHGMLWLQTHFTQDDWEALSDGRAALSQKSVDELLVDARSAGLNVDATPIGL